jgi:ribosome maturation factor RimP
VLQRARAFGLKPFAWSRSLTAARASKLDVGFAPSLERLAAQSDVLSIHLPLTAQTRGIVSRTVLEALPQGAIIINTARAELVDVDALIELAPRKQLRVGFDVFPNQPGEGSASFSAPLASLPHSLATPHLGAATRQAQRTLSEEVVHVVRSFLTEEDVPNVVNVCAASPARYVVVLRQLDKVGALANTLAVLKRHGINIEEISNTVFDGARAVCTKLRVSGRPSESCLREIGASKRRCTWISSRCRIAPEAVSSLSRSKARVLLMALAIEASGGRASRRACAGVDHRLSCAQKSGGSASRVPVSGPAFRFCGAQSGSLTRSTPGTQVALALRASAIDETRPGSHHPIPSHTTMLRSPRTIDPAIARVRELARPIAASHGVELVDVAWSSDRGSRVLRVVLEVAGLAQRQLEAQLEALEASQAFEGALPDPAGGVSLEDCARFSRKLSEALDAEEDAVPGAYLLEVSSPGLERALLSVADFVRFRGLVARVKLARPRPTVRNSCAARSRASRASNSARCVPATSKRSLERSCACASMASS